MGKAWVLARTCQAKGVGGGQRIAAKSAQVNARRFSAVAADARQLATRADRQAGRRVAGRKGGGRGGAHRVCPAVPDEGSANQLGRGLRRFWVCMTSGAAGGVE